MTKLSDTQLVILNRAAQRDDRGLATFDKRAETKEAITGLLKVKLLVIIPKTPELAGWEPANDGSPTALAITPAGLKLLGHEASPSSTESANTTDAERRPGSKGKGKGKAFVNAKQIILPKKGKTSAASDESQPRAGSKLASVIALLRKAKGATISDLMEATGWQAHSVRGAMSGALKKKLGLTISSERQGEERRYRIAG